MDLGGNGSTGSMMPAERQSSGGAGGGGRLDFSSNGQTGFHNSRADGGSGKYRAPDGRMLEIRNVWADNLEKEMVVIRELVERYPFVAMDTEFPGVVARPVGDFNQPDYQYQTLRCNVDMLKMIQLGLSFANEKGELPDIGCCTWQFNFAFNLSEDMYAHDSIQLLKNSGIDFELHQRRGIDLRHFGELLMTSGLVLMPNVTWLSFHSGYDFGYLVKVLTIDNLPQQESDFFDLLHLYFPKLYDIKFLVSSQDGFHGGLNKLADDLKVERIGPMHQAGSDSLLTEQVFLKVADVFFNGVENLDKGKFKGKFSGQLYGYGGNQTGIYRPPHKAQHPNGVAAAAAASATTSAGNGANSATSASASAAGASSSGANAAGGVTASGGAATSSNSLSAGDATASATVAGAEATAAAVAAGGGAGATGDGAPGSTAGVSASSTTAGGAGQASTASAAAGLASAGGGTSVGGNVVNPSAAASAMANPAASGDPNAGEDDSTASAGASGAGEGGGVSGEGQGATGSSPVS